LFLLVSRYTHGIFVLFSIFFACGEDLRMFSVLRYVNLIGSKMWNYRAICMYSLLLAELETCLVSDSSKSLPLMVLELLIIVRTCHFA